MSNTFNAAVDLTGVLADIATVNAVVDAIRATDFPNTDGLIATVDTVVDAIRATDFPNTDGLIATVDTVVDAIRATDFPATNALITAKKAHGQYKKAFLSTSEFALQEVVNVSGSGVVILNKIWADGDNAKVKLNIDGINSNEVIVATPNYEFLSFSNITSISDVFQLMGVANAEVLMIEYKNSFIAYLGTGTGSPTARSLVYYIED